jgi:hypothetical protein
VLTVNEDPAEAVGVLGCGAEDCLCDAGAGEAIQLRGQSMCSSAVEKMWESEVRECYVREPEAIRRIGLLEGGLDS